MSRLNNSENRQLLLQAINTQRAAQQAFRSLRAVLGVSSPGSMERLVKDWAGNDRVDLDDAALENIFCTAMAQSHDYVLVDPAEMAAMFNSEEHPGFPRTEWRMHVIDEKTELGYWAWATEMLHKDYE
jgi:hypothetical protein